MMAAQAKGRNLRNGSIVTAGTANAQTFTSGVGYTVTVPTGLLVRLKIGPALTHTASATLNMDGIGAVVILDQRGNALGPGMLVAGSYADFIFNGTNWILIFSAATAAPTRQVFTSGSGTYTPTAGVRTILVRLVGGGGGGGGIGTGTTGVATTFGTLTG